MSSLEKCIIPLMTQELIFRKMSGNQSPFLNFRALNDVSNSIAIVLSITVVFVGCLNLSENIHERNIEKKSNNTKMKGNGDE